MHVLGPLGGYTLRQLAADPLIIQRALADMKERCIGVETIRRTHVMLQGVLQRAVEWNKLTSNPARQIRKLQRVRRSEVQPISPDQIEAMRSWLLSEGRVRDATLLCVLAYAGVRPGEALALQWKHVSKLTIHVEQAVRDGELKTTKTGKTRSVRLFAPLARDLERWREVNQPVSPDHFIFPRGDGRPFVGTDWVNWLHRTFRPACEVANVGRLVEERINGRKCKRWRAADGVELGPRPYDLRHSFVSLLIKGGSNVVEVASQAGHGPNLCLDTYAHVFADYDPSDRSSAEERIEHARESRLRVDCVSRAAGHGLEERDGAEIPAPEVRPMSGFEPLTPSLRVHCNVRTCPDNYGH
jgi:integrase